jgi:hypothetical protein
MYFPLFCICRLILWTKGGPFEVHELVQVVQACSGESVHPSGRGATEKYYVSLKQQKKSSVDEGRLREAAWSFFSLPSGFFSFFLFSFCCRSFFLFPCRPRFFSFFLSFLLESVFLSFLSSVFVFLSFFFFSSFGFSSFFLFFFLNDYFPSVFLSYQ